MVAPHVTTIQLCEILEGSLGPPTSYSSLLSCFLSPSNREGKSWFPDRPPTVSNCQEGLLALCYSHCSCQDIGSCWCTRKSDTAIGTKVQVPATTARALIRADALAVALLGMAGTWRAVLLSFAEGQAVSDQTLLRAKRSKA